MSDLARQRIREKIVKHRRGEDARALDRCRQDLPLAAIQGVPGEWITSAPNRDEAWTKVSESLRPALDSAKQRKRKAMEERLRRERGGPG